MLGVKVDSVAVWGTSVIAVVGGKLRLLYAPSAGIKPSVREYPLPPGIGEVTAHPTGPSAVRDGRLYHWRETPGRDDGKWALVGSLHDEVTT